MSKTRPFLIGTALGASAMFFSLQYHVVHSPTGLQVIPRSPQQSIGLAYADVRNWSPTQWADRPELARALMANGSGELIASSVADSLSGGTPEESTTLDELRSFLNKSRVDLVRSTLATSSKANPEDSSDRDSTTNDHEDLGQPIPFPSDAGSSPIADPFQRPSSAATSAQKPSRFSDTEVLEGLAQPRSKSSGSSRGNSLIDQALEVERKIFGDQEDSQETSATPESTSRKAPAPLFEEVTTALENQAQQMLDEIRNSNTSRSSVATSIDSPANFNRSSTSRTEPTTVPATPEPSVPASDDFDPFLE